MDPFLKPPVTSSSERASEAETGSPGRHALVWVKRWRGIFLRVPPPILCFFSFFFFSSSSSSSETLTFHISTNLRLLLPSVSVLCFRLDFDLSSLLLRTISIRRRLPLPPYSLPAHGQKADCRRIPPDSQGEWLGGGRSRRGGPCGPGAARALG